LLLIPAAGCSPAIGQWAARGQVGCGNELTNATAWRDLAVEMLEAQRRANIAAVFTDIKAVAAGRIFGADGDQKPIPLDDAWVDEAHQALSAVLGALDKRRAAVDQMYDRHKANIEQTRESFDRIKQLNVVWAGANNQLAVQMETLISEIKRMRQEAAKNE